jgi:hypothetical protein
MQIFIFNEGGFMDKETRELVASNIKSDELRKMFIDADMKKILFLLQLIDNHLSNEKSSSLEESLKKLI